MCSPKVPTTGPERPSLSDHSLRVRTTSDPKIVLNVSEQYIDIQYDDNEFLQVHRRCAPEMLNDVNWTATESGNLAAQSCPPPYSGSVSRPCFSGSWGPLDYSDCRLENLREIQSLVSRTPLSCLSSIELIKFSLFICSEDKNHRLIRSISLIVVPI